MKLIFVYNVSGGITQSILDTVHKTVSPDSQECKLCQLTLGPLSMKSKWRKYLRSLPYEIVFMHKDEFHNQYPGVNVSFPAVLQKDGTQFQNVLTSMEINSFASLDDLIAGLQERLQTKVQ